LPAIIAPSEEEKKKKKRDILDCSSLFSSPLELVYYKLGSVSLLLLLCIDCV
jgi:hypothetical protein